MKRFEYGFRSGNTAWCIGEIEFGPNGMERIVGPKGNVLEVPDGYDYRIETVIGEKE